MARKTEADFDPDLLVLFNAYVHGAIDRRGFLDKARKYRRRPDRRDAARSTEPELRRGAAGFSRGQTAEDGTGFVSVPFGEREDERVLVRPANAAGKLPAVLVVHENRGLNPHIEDIARRLALENFLTFAPDALAAVGGYPGNEDKARELFATLDRAKTAEDILRLSELFEDTPRVHRQDRRRRFLLGRRRGAHTRDQDARPRRRGPVLRRSPGAGGGAEGQGRPPRSPCGQRSAGHRFICGVRAGVESSRCAL